MILRPLSRRAANSLLAGNNKQQRKTNGMIARFQVFTEIHNRWPARGDRPAGESFNLLLLDLTKPSAHALRGMCQYRLTEDERVAHWGKLEGKTVELGINDIHSGEKSALLRGTILSVAEK